MILNETYELNNGVKIPKVGLGTWFIKDKDASEAVRNAVKTGYRLIDTAEAYANEKGIGEGIRTCGIPRAELFVTTKILAEAKTYGEAKQCIEGSLHDLNLDYIDLMIIHAPQPWKQWRDKKERYFAENLQVWKALEDAYEAGKLKAIGVSNFLIDDLQNILDHCRVKPAVNQVLNHVGNVPKELIEFCQKKDVLVESYAPLGHGKLMKNEEIEAIAAQHHVTVAQVCMRFDVQMGTVAIPKAGSVEHMKENAAIDFELSADEMERLAKVRFKGYGMMKVMPVFSGRE